MEDQSSKENQSEKDHVVTRTKQNIKKDAKGLAANIKHFLRELLDFRDDTDREATIKAIQEDISFKGATAWILVCSIFVASIGLNANSTAVVIGAMLISPLMGPILGIGLSIAINDIYTLKRSLINLATMIVLSLLTAFLFFKLFPLSEDTNELLGRVKPDIRDVLIAFFGGLALIIARTKKGTIASVIFGVAIATALMPPLCTAGYGLAKGNFGYFSGAMYLFMINTIFIALATFLVLKVLRFPMLRYANSKRRQLISRLATLLAVIVMIPAGFTFVKVYKESNFNRDARLFINKELTALPHAEYVKNNTIYAYSEDNTGKIEINTFGLDKIPEGSINLLKERMKDYDALLSCELIINQNKNLDNFRYMQELRTRDSLDLLSQTEKIAFLEKRVHKLSKLEQQQFDFSDLAEEVRINYEGIASFSYANMIRADFKQVKIDTIPIFYMSFSDTLLSQDLKVKEKNKLQSWLKTKLKTDNLIVKFSN